MRSPVHQFLSIRLAELQFDTQLIRLGLCGFRAGQYAGALCGQSCAEPSSVYAPKKIIRISLISLSFSLLPNHVRNDSYF